MILFSLIDKNIDLIIMINNSLTFLIQVTTLLVVVGSKMNKTLSVDLQTLQNQINRLERHNLILSGLNKNQIVNHAQSINNTRKAITNDSFIKKVSYQQLQISKQMKNHCEIDANSHNQYFLFQTPRNFYIGVNRALQHFDSSSNFTFYNKQFAIFNSQCRKIASIQNVFVKQIYCDRGLCDDGNVIILTHDLDLIICSQTRNFSSCSTYATIKNVIKGHPVGGAIRNKGSGQFQVYIADSQGQIIVFDGQGKPKLSIPLESDSKISYFVDIHPYPLIISSKGWIYSLQNTKYTLHLTKCPYLFHKINRVFVSHPYSSILYLMSEEAITKLEIKTQSKNCDVISKYFLTQFIDELVNQNIGIAQYQGQLFIGDKIINLQSKQIKKFIDCDSHTSFNFQLMKNTYRKGFFTLSCCHKQQINNQQESLLRKSVQKCSIIIFNNINDEQSSSKNNTVLMIVILFFIMLVIFYLLKSNNPNLDYDEQLKYSNNLRYKNQVQQYLKSKSNSKTSPPAANIPNTSRQSGKVPSSYKKNN